MRPRVLIGVAVVAALVLVAGPAWAATNEFNPSGSSGDYSNASNWSLGHVPLDGEDVVIKSGKTCNVDQDTETLRTFSVESTAVANITPGKTVEVGSAELVTSTISGTININPSSAPAGYLSFVATHTVSGSGKIVGGLDGSGITIVSGKTLINTITIEGRLTISGDGAFTNSGLINATTGTIWVNAGQVDDTSAGTWKVSGASAILRWDDIASAGSAAVSLDGDFVVDSGTLDIDHPAFTTTGSLTYTGGAIDCSGAGNATEFTGS